MLASRLFRRKTAWALPRGSGNVFSAERFLCAALLLVPSISAQVIPEAVQPPRDQTLILRSKGKGKQIYVCQTTAGVSAWKLKAPDANLYNETGEQIGHHFAGPTWQSSDGSRVVGKMIANTPSPDADSIPWLLLTATSHDGKGIFFKVQSIQRLDTKGGKAPSSACSEGQETSVPYEATYYFYGQP